MIYLIIATLSAYFIKGLCGFGNTPIFNSIAAFNLNNKNISPIELLVGLPANILISIRGRKIIDYSLCIKLISFIFVGTIVGTYALNVIDPKIVKIVCGFVTIFVAIKMGINDDVKLFKNRIFVILTCLFSGIICGMYGIGIFMVPFVKYKSKNNEIFKSNMGFISMFDNLIRVFLYKVSGIMTLISIKTAIVLIPFSIFSLYLGFYVSKYVNENLAKKMATILLFITGASLIVSNLL